MDLGFDNKTSSSRTRLKTWLKCDVQPARLRIAFCGPGRKLSLPPLPPSESWSLFKPGSGCCFDILLTCAFAEPDMVLLLIGQDLVSQDKCVPARLSVTSPFGKAAFASPSPRR